MGAYASSSGLRAGLASSRGCNEIDGRETERRANVVGSHRNSKSYLGKVQSSYIIKTSMDIK